MPKSINEDTTKKHGDVTVLWGLFTAPASHTQTLRHLLEQ